MAEETRLIGVVIIKYFVDLKTNLRHPISLADTLFAERWILEDEYDTIKAQGTPQSKAGELLQTLKTKSDAALCPLYNFVKKSNPWLARQIKCSIEDHKAQNIGTYPTSDISFNTAHYAEILDGLGLDKIPLSGTFKVTTSAANILPQSVAIVLAIAIVIALFGGFYYLLLAAKPGELQGNNTVGVRETEDPVNPPISIPARIPIRNVSFFIDYNGKEITSRKSDEVTNVTNSDFTTKHPLPKTSISTKKLELINQDSHISSDFASLSLYGPSDWEAVESITIIISSPNDTFSDITSYLSNKTKVLSLEGNYLSRSHLMEFLDSNMSYSLEEINFSGADICNEFYTPDQPCSTLYTLHDLSVMTFTGIRSECSDLFQYLRKCVNYGHPFYINVSDSLLVYAGRSDELSKLETLSGNPIHYTKNVVGNTVEIGARYRLLRRRRRGLARKR